ncbi:MAG: DUF1674 domain-containing protein [Pseudomonadota bacterium]
MGDDAPLDKQPNDDAEALADQEVPTTDDGIPLIVNGEKLSETAIQALREARARKDAIDERAKVPREMDGGDRKSEPTRYGDWEKDGRAYDFS